MRLLVTGVGGLIGSNLAAAAAQQSWSVLGTWRSTPVSVPGVRTVRLDLADRRACVRLAEEFEPDLVVHAAAESSPGRLEREPRLARLNLLAAESTLAAAHTVRARYLLVSCEHVFSGVCPPGERWQEEDPTEPLGAIGRSQLACEELVRRFGGGWLITRPADVYGVNLAIPFAARARHVWERSGPALRWVGWLRAGQALAAPTGVLRTPTYAWDYAQVACELIAQECEGVYHTAGPTVLGRLAYLRLLARAFECDLELVQEGSPAAFLRASGELAAPPSAGPPRETPPESAGPPTRGVPPESAGSPTRGVPPEGIGPPLPLNTALSDRLVSFVLGRNLVDPFAGLRLTRRQLERVLGRVGLANCESLPLRAGGGLV
jgi:dTDP-4-dehydrorhamnose reductase